MADIILPDDVFTNMQHAQEAAESMEKAVTEFNSNIEKNFNGKEKNDESKLKEEIKPTLSAQEKTRYRNIGNAFFEGAKNQIIDIYKQIEKNKKRSIFKKAAALVAKKVDAIKENIDEHKTGLKILAVITLIGGIYYLFKDWFDKNLPPIWESFKNSISSLADGASSLSSKLADMLANNEILDSIKEFVVNAGKTIAKFFETIGNQITSLFSDTTGPGSFTNSSAKQELDTISSIEERKKNDPVFAQLYDEIHDGKKNSELDKKNKRYSEELEQLYILQQQGKGNDKIKGWDGKEWTVLDRIKDLESGIKKNKEERDENLKLIEDTLNVYKQHEDKYAATMQAQGDKHVFAQIKKARESNNTAEVYKLLQSTGILEQMADSQSFYWASGSENSLEELMFAARDGDKEAQAYLNAVADSMISRYDQENGVVQETQEQIKAAEDEAEKAKDEIEKHKQEMIQSANVPKLTNVAVISSLDEFVKNFFDGDKPGSFKAFSSEFLTGFKEVIENFKIGASIAKHVNSLHDKVNTLFDELNDYGTSIIDSLDDKTQKIKDFIVETFETAYIDELNGFLTDVAKYEKEQVDCLNEQLNVLKQTTLLLAKADIGNGKNVTIVQNQPSSENSVNAFDMPEPENQHTATAMRFVGDLSM